MAKERTLNEYRQTKEHYVPKERVKRNVPRHPKSYEDPVQKVLAQQIEELEHAGGIKEMVDKHQADKYDGDINKEEMNPSKYTEDELEQAKEAIVDKITKHFQDVMFEMVCEEMSDNYLFQSSNYLTEAGYDMFEDEWFEFYHEHHGDILYQVMQNITN